MEDDSPAPIALRAMTIADHPEVVALWRRSEGIGLNESDAEDPIGRFLARNPGMSAVAVGPAGAIVGAVLCGWDGRRGYLHHLAVDRRWRGRGVARRLLERCRQQLDLHGMPKCSVFLFRDHDPGADFWRHAGFSARDELLVFQTRLAGGSDVPEARGPDRT